MLPTTNVETKFRLRRQNQDQLQLVSQILQNLSTAKVITTRNLSYHDDGDEEDGDVNDDDDDKVIIMAQSSGGPYNTQPFMLKMN